MSRASVILIVVLVVIVVAMIGLTMIDTEVAPKTVSKSMMNEAQPR